MSKSTTKQSTADDAGSRENTDYDVRRVEPTVSGQPKAEEIRQAEVMPGETEPTENAAYVEYLETQNADENAVNGVKDQLIYPDREVNAERAAAHAAGKVESLYPTEDEKKQSAKSSKTT